MLLRDLFEDGDGGGATGGAASGSTSATSIAGVRSGLFDDPIVRGNLDTNGKIRKKRKIPVITFHHNATGS